MTADRFAALSRLIRMRGGAAQKAARLVLVCGMRPADAARETGITPQSVCNAVARVRKANAIIAADGSMRRLASGREVTSMGKAVEIKLKTRCPEKWAFFDLETRQIWMHDGNQFRPPTSEEVAEIKEFAKKRGIPRKNIPHICGTTGG